MYYLKKYYYLFALVLFTATLGWSYAVLLGGGYNPTLKDAVLLSLLVVATTSSKKFFYFIGIPVFGLMSLYFPIGMNYGSVSFQHISSLIATDVSETAEFFTTIPLKDLCLGLLLFLELPICYFFQRSLNINFFRNKTFVIISLFYLCVSYGPFQGPKDTYKATKEVLKELHTLNGNDLPSKWQIKSAQPSYKNHILIIGESVRRDYMGIYGYPIENTPFLSSVNATIIEGLTGSDTYTIGALRVMLTKTSSLSEANYSLSLMDLAKAGKFSTAWISNQGFLGKFDTQVSTLAKKAERVHFLKYGDYVSNNLDDEELLPYLQKELNREDERSKLIVLHLMGSHVSPCERLHNYPIIVENFDQSKKLIACYITSIRKTDDLIKKVYLMLKERQTKNNESFSLIYTSDHGLCMQNDPNGNLTMTNGCISRWHRDLPLIKISSDDNEKKYIKAKKYSNNFVEGIAEWMGITTTIFVHPKSLFNENNQDDDLKIEEKVKEGILDYAISF